MQLFLAAKIVVEKGLVHLCGAGDFVHARSGQSLLGKNIFGGGHDAPRGGKIPRLPQAAWYAPAQARQFPLGAPRTFVIVCWGFHSLTNWLV